MANRPLTKRVIFKTLNGRAIVNQLDGRERAYPAYRFGGRNFFERPEVPGQTYRRYQDIVE
jgi:hypothetical protein